MPTIYSIVLLILLVAATAMAVRQWRRARRIETLCDAGLKNCDKLSKQCLELAELAREQKTRGDGFFDVIEKVCVERDSWNQAYHEASSGHRSAQQMLMTELTRLSKLLTRAAKICTDLPNKAHTTLTPEEIQNVWRLCLNHVDPKIAIVVAEYSERHGDDGIAADIPVAPSGIPEEAPQPPSDAAA